MHVQWELILRQFDLILRLTVTVRTVMWLSIWNKLKLRSQESNNNNSLLLYMLFLYNVDNKND